MKRGAEPACLPMIGRALAQDPCVIQLGLALPPVGVCGELVARLAMTVELGAPLFLFAGLATRLAILPLLGMRW